MLNTPIGPTSPHVPIPDAIATGFSILNTAAESAPVISEHIVGGSQITGFLTILPIWSILVPSPWAITPLHLFAAKLITAKPTICAQQPAVAAPPAMPVSASDAQIQQTS